MNRLDMVRANHPGASEEALQRYCDLRDEGHSQYAAGLMSGLRDPDELDEAKGEQP